MLTTVTCRKATEADVEHLHALIATYAERGIMLPRSKEALLRAVDSFVVAEVDGVFAGCGSLCRLGEDLAEIRSLGVVEHFQGQGIGRRIVEMLVDQARRSGIPKVMALTYEVAFFERLGFTVVAKEIFPEKVWTDCVHCPKRHCCDEIAVMKRLS